MKCILPFLMLGMAATLSYATTPYVFHVTKSALADDIVGIQGDQFGGSPEVWMDRLETGDSVANPEVQLTDIVSSSDDYIGVKLPNGLATGVYAIFVRNGVADSAPAWINRAEGWHLLDMAGRDIFSGYTLRISGRNLAFAAVTPQVRFVRVSDGFVRAATGVASVEDGYVLQCTAPTGMTNGEQYYVEVNNGLSNLSTIWTRLPGAPLDVRATTGDPFGVGVPWGADFNAISTNVYNVKSAPFNAAGNGVTDDRAAIQLAIDTATTAGGGTVYFPAGTYYIGYTNISTVDFHLLTRANVVLKGGGIGVSILESHGRPGVANAGLAYVLPVPGYYERVGFKDLTLHGDQYALAAVYNPVAYRSFVVDCRLETDGPALSSVLAWGGAANQCCEILNSIPTTMTAWPPVLPTKRILSSRGVTSSTMTVA